MLTQEHIVAARVRIGMIHEEAVESGKPVIQHMVETLGLNNNQMRGFMLFLRSQPDVNDSDSYHAYFEGFLLGIVAARMELADGDSAKIT